MAIKTNYIVAPWLLYMVVTMGTLIFMLGWWVGDKNQLKHLDPVKSKLLSMPDLKLTNTVSMWYPGSGVVLDCIVS